MVEREPTLYVVATLCADETFSAINSLEQVRFAELKSGKTPSNILVIETGYADGQNQLVVWSQSEQLLWVLRALMNAPGEVTFFPAPEVQDWQGFIKQGFEMNTFLDLLRNSPEHSVFGDEIVAVEQWSSADPIKKS